jgi:predicted Zn-dependent protease
MRNSWTGFHYDGKTANREPVTVTLTGIGLHVVRADGVTFQWSFDEMRRADPLGYEAFRIERGGEPAETLLINEEGFPEAVRVVAPHAGKRFSKWAAFFDTSTRSTATNVAFGIAIVAAVYFIGLPALAVALAPHIPLAWEEELGRGLVDQVAQRSSRCESEVAQKAVNAIVARLIATVPENPYQFRVTLADDSVVNAFAAPGGFVVVNRGLLEATRTPEELAGVLAHEVQHVLRHHSTRAMVREIPQQIVVGAISGGHGLAALGSRAVGTLGVLRYHRGDEAEADREGIRMLQAARIDPRGMLDFFHTLAQRSPSEPRLASYLSTHPQTADRISALEQLASQSSYQPVPLLPGTSWREVQSSCGSLPTDK